MPGKVRGLYKWCQKVTEGYEGLEITNMTSSWKNGLALCALINRFRPDLIDFYSLSPENVYYNNDLAFTIAEKEFDIPKFLDPEDMVTMEAPDRQSMATYLAEFYEHFKDKPMYDPPDMPPGWPSCVPLISKPVSAISSEKENLNSLYSAVSESKNIENETEEKKDMEIQNLDKEIEVEDKVNDDIDDLYKGSLELLEAEKTEVTFNQACRSEIQEIKTAKKGAVIQAIVCAGIAAVAATTVGDDTEHYDSSDRKEEEGKVSDVEVLNDIESKKQENEKFECQYLETLDTDETEVKSYEDGSICDTDKSKPDLFRSDSGIGTANTEVLKETVLNVLQVKGQFENDPRVTEQSPEQQLITDTKKTVDLLNDELNKGELEIVNVNVVETKSGDSSDSKSSSEDESLDQNDQESMTSVEKCATSTKNEENMSCEFKEYSDSRSSSLGSGSNIEESFASELVENIFNEVKSNPELIAEITKELPSIVKEVECELEIVNENLRSEVYLTETRSKTDTSKAGFQHDMNSGILHKERSSSSSSSDSDQEISKDNCGPSDINKDLKEDIPDVSQKEELEVEVAKPKKFQPQRQSYSSSSSSDTNIEEDVETALSQTNLEFYSEQPVMPANEDVTLSICVDVKDVHPVVCDRTVENEEKLTDNETKAEQLKRPKDTSLKSSSSSSSLEFNDDEGKAPEQCKTVVELIEQNKPLPYDSDETEKTEKYQIEQTSEIKEELNKYKVDISEVKRHSKSSSSSDSDDDTHLTTSENDSSCVLPDISANTVDNLSVTEDDIEIHPDNTRVTPVVNVEQMSEIYNPEQQLSQRDACNNEKGLVTVKPERHSTSSSSSSSSSDSYSETAEYNTTRDEIPVSENITDNKQINEIKPVAVTTLNCEFSENVEKAEIYQPEKHTSVVNEDTNEHERENLEFEQRTLSQSSASSSDSKSESITVSLENKSFLESNVQETIPSENTNAPTHRDNVCVTTPQSEKQTADCVLKEEFWQPKEQLLELEEKRIYQPDKLFEPKKLHLSSTSSASDSDTNGNLDTLPIDHDTVLNDLIQKNPDSVVVTSDKRMNDSKSPVVAVSVSASQSLQNIPESETKTDVETSQESEELWPDLLWSKQGKRRQSTSSSSSASVSDEDVNDVLPKEIALSSKTSAIDEDNAYFHTDSEIPQPFDIHVRLDASKENLHDCKWKTDEDQLQTKLDSCDELSKLREKHQSSASCDSETEYVVPLDNKSASFKAREDVNDSGYAERNKPLNGSDTVVSNDGMLPEGEKREKEYQPVSSFQSSESRDEEEKSHEPVKALKEFKDLMLEHTEPLSRENSNQGFKTLSPPVHSVPSSRSDSDGEAPALPVEGPPKVLFKKTLSDASDEEIRDELNLQAGVEVEQESTDREDTSEKNPPSEDVQKPKYDERKSSSSSSSSSTSSDDEDILDKTTQDSQLRVSSNVLTIEDSLLNELKNLSTTELDFESGTKPEAKDVDNPELLAVENEKPEVKEIINISTSSITRTEPEPKVSESEDLKKVKLGVPGVKLEWSCNASDDKFEAQRTSDFKQPDDSKKLEKPADKQTLFADIDTGLMKKAAIMSRKMAESITSKMEDQKKSESGTLDKGDFKKEEKYIVSPTEKPDLDERKARKLAMFRQLQYSTRPKMKRLDDSDGSSDSDSGFRSKLQMFARKSSTNTDSDMHKLNHSPLSVAVPRKKISSPFLQSPSPTDEQKHLKKLHECLPENPAPGSVAEYIRKISLGTFSKPNYEGSCPDYEKEMHSPMNSKKITKLQSEDSDEVDKLTKTPNFKTDDKAQLEQKTKEINPSCVFAGRPIMRRHTMQDRKLPVRPMSIELKYEKEQELRSKEYEKPPIPPPRLHRKKQEKLKVDIRPLEEKPVVSNIQPVISESDLSNSFKETDESNYIRRDSLKDKVDIEVKSLEKQPTLSDEEKQEEEKRNELKRQDSLKRRQSPRRALSLSSPTRSDFTDKDGERIRNIWQDPAKKPPSPKVKRSNSFEIKVRPISQQLTPDEKEQRKKEKELERSNSFKSDSSSRPPTPTKNQQKLPVVVKPLSAQDSNENKQNSEAKLLDSVVSAKPLQTNISSENGSESDTSDASKKSSSPISKKPPKCKKKSSILSLIGSIAHPKSEGNGKPLIVDEIVVAKSVARVETSSPIETAMINSPLSKVSGKSCENEIILPNTVADNVTDESFAKVEEKPLTKVENGSKKELENETTVTQQDKRRSKFKDEQEEVIRKCNSIFGLVKSRVKPGSNETVERSVSAKANTLNCPETLVKGETIDVKSSPPESNKKKELGLSSSSSSASTSPEMKRKKIDTVNMSSVNSTVNTDSDLGNVVEYPTRPDTETLDNIKNNHTALSASSPSLNSSAEIVKEELKEGLKSIIKDLENGMKSEGESDNCIKLEDEKGKTNNYESANVSVKLGVRLNLESDYHLEDVGEKNTVKEGTTFERQEEAVKPVSEIFVSKGSVENEKITTSTESSSEDDKKQITNEYKKLLNSKSIETPNDVGPDKNIAQDSYKCFPEEEICQNLKAEMEPDKKDRHLSSRSSSEDTDLNVKCKSSETVTVDKQSDRPDSDQGINLDATEFLVSESLNINSKSSLKESGESEKKKKDRKRRKKKRRKSESSSSSESSHTDSDKDDENDDGKNSNNTPGDSSGNKYKGSENDNEDRNRKSSSGSDNSTQSGASKEAHVLSIDIPGEGAVVLQNNMDSHSLKNSSLVHMEDKDYHADEEHSEIDDEINDKDDKFSNQESVPYVELQNIKDTLIYGRQNDINHLGDLSINKRTEDRVNDSGNINVSKTMDAGTTGSEVEVTGTIGSLKSTSDSDSSQSSSSESISDDSGSEGGASSNSDKLAVEITTRPTVVKELSVPKRTDRTSSKVRNLEVDLKDEIVQPCLNVATRFMRVDNDKTVKEPGTFDISGNDVEVVKDLPSCIEDAGYSRIASIAQSSQSQRKYSSTSSSSRESQSDAEVSSLETKDVDERMNVNVPSKVIRKEQRTSSCSHTSEDSLSDSDENLEQGYTLDENNTKKNFGDSFESLAQDLKSSNKVIAVESTCSEDNEDKRISVCPSSENSDIENDSETQDTCSEEVKEEKYKQHSSSRSDFSSSESESNYVEKGESETEDDELLKSVIEDAEPFRAPLLEDVIKSASLESSELEGNIQKQENERIGIAESEHHEAENIGERENWSGESEKSSSGSETDSSDDLYSDSKRSSEKDQYILPECNKISTDFDFIPKKDSYFLPDYEYKPVPVDVQVFVIPDGPIDKHFYPVLKDPEILIADDNNILNKEVTPIDVLDLNEEIIIPVEPVVVADLEGVSDKSHVDLSKEIEKSFDEKKNVDVSDIILEPLEGTEFSESEDELLKNILLQNEMNLYSIEKRKSSTSSCSSADEINVRVNSKIEIGSDKETGVMKLVSPVKEKENIEDKSAQIDTVKYKDAQYENVFIIKKPDYVTDLCKNDIVICKKVSTDSEIDSLQGGESVSRKSSKSSCSSVNSEDLGINIKHEEDIIHEDIETRSRSNSSSSSSSSDSSRSSISSRNSCSRSSKSEGINNLEVSANMDSEFLIGREKDPSKSEVARLIQQSLEIDRRREELRKQEQERLKVAQELHDQFKPRDEVLEHEHIRHLSESSRDSKTDENVDIDASSVEDDVEEREAEISEELLAGEATPLSMPSAADSDNTDSSPEEAENKPVVEVFDLQESSPEDISPDMESQALFVKLKEAQCKNAVLEAEITKLKAKLVVLENNEAQKKQYERKNEEMAARLREMEKSLTNARKEINHYQDMMEGSQGQYIALEKKLKAEYIALEKKYHKAKKLIKEYQQREKDFLAERESLLQQQSEKDQQYDALVKSLKDRIFQLEGELGEAQKAAGLPVVLPAEDQTRAVESAVVPSVSAGVRSAPRYDSGTPVSPLVDRDSISSESDISAAEPHSTSPAVDAKIQPESAVTFESVPATKLLDTSVNRAKAQLAANSPRRPPTKQRSKSQDSEEMIEAISENKPESGLETWIKHDSDNTVKKSDVRKRRAQQNDSHLPPPVSESPPVVSEVKPNYSEAPPSVDSVPTPPPPPAGPPELPDQSDDLEASRDSESGESSSTLSQTSYDPSKPTFRNKDSEIPGLDTVSTDTTGTTDTAETSESSSSAAAPNKRTKGHLDYSSVHVSALFGRMDFSTFRILPKLPFKFGGSDRDKGGGVMLVSQRSLTSLDDPTPGDGGITLISKKKIDTGLDYDGASTVSDTSSGYMVGEVEQTSYSFSGTPANEDHPSQPGHHSLNQFSSGQITEWNNENVRHWLIGIEMERYAPLFTEKSVTGPQLITMDSNKLKALGISNAKDRDYLKKKVKELKLVLEKERKQMEKERKQMEKEQKQREKEQKKFFSKKK